ncbi:uncharacterized protein LOC127091223 isoform X3 [Lathyrus oleraceus]|uniref:HMA domain-containing protein n=1 Tax=Pisum sativum TaxID=3888 RepID=A0A9D4WES7_PEA|nr:uncharacterized protein LOC127091223 isoform X3 [Pisum sativum]KAI5401534.1 hypothetical protein KIW84_066129 [Pisum sativum]
MAFKDCSINREVQKASGVKVSKSFPLSSLASLESLSLPLVQEVVLSGDMKCENCQKRVSDIINKMNETESIVVNVLEKKVILTFRISSTRHVGKVISHKVTPKVAIMKRIFRSSNG